VYEPASGTLPEPRERAIPPERTGRATRASQWLRRSLALAVARLRLGRRALTLAVGLSASVPVIVATVNAVRDRWVPGADQGIIATRAYDVFTSHAPLVGQYTLAGQVTGKVTHSLGPMLFWLLALPARFGGPTSMTWTMGAVNTLAIVGAVALARRRGGLVLMFAAALAIALMCQSLAAEAFHDVWNPSAGLFPFTLLIFLCWSLACGEYRLLVLAVLVASFVVQAHLMYLPATVGMLAIGIGGLALSLRPSRRGRSGGASRPGRRALLGWTAAAILVGAACWSAPVIDELRGHPGNITLVARAADSSKPTLGASAGWHAVVRAVGVPSWWLHVPASRWQRKYDVRSTPSTAEVDSALAMLAALAAVAVIALIRRRRDVAGGALIGLALCGGLAAVAASTPTPRVLSATLGYTMWLGTHVGMCVWLMLAWSVWLALRWALGRALGGGRARLAARHAGIVAAADAQLRRAPAFTLPLARVVACVAALLATVAVAAAVARTEKPDEHRPTYRPTRALAARLVRAVPSGATVELIGNLDVATMPIKPALRYYLVRHHVRPLADGSYLRLGDWYELRQRPYRYVIWVNNGVRRPARGARLVDRVGVTDRWGHQVVSLWIANAHARPSRPEPARGGLRAQELAARLAA
jgi:hypothetical protein